MSKTRQVGGNHKSFGNMPHSIKLATTGLILPVDRIIRVFATCERAYLCFE